ncbi:hypothetical protein ANN_11655 [Periplaneta americana]|uniref:Reverse transcriptase domain-containing protein n=1 Tax=Periplaneta americana TaxID=6978 RepID=A0ABQ8T7H0_PERAM|nr:hypothetical protein ANN_11655 [Periplaneta americana]
MRPVVNSVNSPNHKINKFLLKYLKEILKMDNRYSLNNSQQLIERLQSLSINKSTKLVSLDIENLYTNIPLDETLKIISEKLRKLNTEEKIINQLMQLLSVCTKQNYFRFDNKYFLQTRGVAMGDSLSGFLADVFLQSLEDKHIEKLAAKHNIISYNRYVDDTLLVFESHADTHEAVFDILCQRENAVHIKSKTLPCEAILDYEFNYSYSKDIPERIWCSQSSQKKHNTGTGKQIGNNWISAETDMHRQYRSRQTMRENPFTFCTNNYSRSYLYIRFDGFGLYDSEMMQDEAGMLMTALRARFRYIILHIIALQTQNNIHSFITLQIKKMQFEEQRILRKTVVNKDNYDIDCQPDQHSVSQSTSMERYIKSAAQTHDDRLQTPFRNSVRREKKKERERERNFHEFIFPIWSNPRPSQINIIFCVMRLRNCSSPSMHRATPTKLDALLRRVKFHNHTEQPVSDLIRCRVGCGLPPDLDPADMWSFVVGGSAIHRGLSTGIMVTRGPRVDGPRHCMSTSISSPAIIDKFIYNFAITINIVTIKRLTTINFTTTTTIANFTTTTTNFTTIVIINFTATNTSFITTININNKNLTTNNFTTTNTNFTATTATNFIPIAVKYTIITINYLTMATNFINIDNAGEMSPGSGAESYPAFSLNGLMESH